LVSITAVSVYLLIAGFIYLSGSTTTIGIAMIGASIFSIGLSIFIFYGCKASVKGVFWLSKKFILLIKKSLARKETA
jgi:hypothetical protein